MFQVNCDIVSDTNKWYIVCNKIVIIQYNNIIIIQRIIYNNVIYYMQCIIYTDIISIYNNIYNSVYNNIVILLAYIIIL